MAVITISRGSFSGGKMLAECLANRLGYRCVDRDMIVERAAAYGVSEDELRDALLKPPGFFDRLFMDRLRHKRYVYLTLIQAALTEEVQTGNAIYHGNAGHLLLKGGGPVLRARIIAPMEFRIAMAMGRHRFSRSDAISYIHRVDRERREWTHYLYGVDWGDPALYDIVVNLEHLGIEQACQVIGNMARQPRFEITSKGQASMDNLALASRVRANLAIDPATSHLEVEVTADQGRVVTRAKLATPDEIVEIQRVAKSTPGVRELTLEQLTPGPPG
jgi:cytidylate kinase